MRKFIQMWEENKLDGSVNVETVQALLAATEVLAARDWPLKNFFINLESSLRSIIASEEKLPRIPKDTAEPSSALTNKKNMGKQVPSMFGPMKDQKESPIGGVAEPESTEATA